MTGFNFIDLIAVVGGGLAAFLTYLQIKGMREKRSKERELAAVAAHGAPEQRVSVIVNSAETAVVLLRNALERAETEITRKDSENTKLRAQIANLEQRVRELERAKREEG